MNQGRVVTDGAVSRSAALTSALMWIRRNLGGGCYRSAAYGSRPEAAGSLQYRQKVITADLNDRNTKLSG